MVGMLKWLTLLFQMGVMMAVMMVERSSKETNLSVLLFAFPDSQQFALTSLFDLLVIEYKVL